MFDPIVRELQRRIEELSASYFRLERRMAGNEQSLAKNWANTPQGGTSSTTTTVWFCEAPSAVTAGTVLPGGSATSFTADVYTLTGGSYVLAETDADCYHPWPSALTSGRQLALGKNPDGSYSVLVQSCS